MSESTERNLVPLGELCKYITAGALVEALIYAVFTPIFNYQVVGILSLPPSLSEVYFNAIHIVALTSIILGILIAIIGIAVYIVLKKTNKLNRSVDSAYEILEIIAILGPTFIGFFVLIGVTNAL